MTKTNKSNENAFTSSLSLFVLMFIWASAHTTIPPMHYIQKPNDKMALGYSIPYTIHFHIHIM